MSTPNLVFNVPLVGASGWGPLLNQNFTRLDGFLSGGLVLPTVKVTSLILNGGAPLGGQNGAGNIVLTTGAVLVTPTLGVASGTSLALGGGSPLATTNATGTGNLVLSDSPTFTGSPTFPAGSIPTAALAANAVSQLVGVNCATNFSSASSSFVDVTNAAVTLTTAGGQVLVIATGPGHSVAQTGFLTLGADGVDGVNFVVLNQDGQLNIPWTIMRVFSPSAGSHTYKLRAKVTSGGTVSTLFSSANGFIIALELKK